jgi:predicted RecB family nuclease
VNSPISCDASISISIGVERRAASKGDAIVTSGLVTRSILEGYLHCKYLAHLRLGGREGIRSDYEKAVQAVRQERCFAITDTLRARYGEQGPAIDVSVTRAELRKGAELILGAELEDETFDIRIDGLKRVEGHSDLGPFHYVPMLFSESHTIHRWHRQLLASLGTLIGRLQKRAPTRGVMYHGEPCAATSIQFGAAARAGEDTVHDLARMRRNGVPPPLHLNDHCSVCEFRVECRGQAIKEDSLTLLRGFGEKEVKRYARRGIFTLTQLSHTFRPRRLGKGAQPVNVRQYALQALAIRDRTVYVFGTPDVPAGATDIYLDMEGKPDEQFVYLIGLVVRCGDREDRHSFWADSRADEQRIFEQMLAVVAEHPDACVYTYGAYERTFIKRLREGARCKGFIDELLSRLVNVLSIIYAHFYFPTYSNGLKEIGALLGCTWSDEQASGLQSIVWRMRWERNPGELWKDTLLQYNLDDCIALGAVVAFLRSATDTGHAASAHPEAAGTSGPRITPVEELAKTRYVVPWRKFANPDLLFVNKRAYFDYQRQRVYVRGKPALRRRYRARGENLNRKVRVSKRVQLTASSCPACGSRNLEAIAKPTSDMGMITRSKRTFHLHITESGIKRQAVDYRATMYRCRDCDDYFSAEVYHRLARYSHSVMSWVTYHSVVHNLSIAAIQDMFRDFFGATLHSSEIMMFRSLMASYYRSTYNSFLDRLVSGALLHVDETSVTLRTGAGYVWVFANMEHVIYLYRPNREGAFLHSMLKGFAGVLVSDFYAAYDSLDCPKQRCLIHLIRDMNQDVIGHPYDSEVQAITERFGALLRAVVQTVDEDGLKRRSLRKHASSVAAFFRELSEQAFASEPAQALRARLIKNRDQLFTFIGYDDVPWNNNSAEHAIRQFSYFRDETAPSMKEQGLLDYLVLLSVFQTCKYKGVSFWKFLLSEQKDIDLFASGVRFPRHRRLELYPAGFDPPHLAKVRQRNALRPTRRATWASAADSQPARQDEDLPPGT